MPYKVFKSKLNKALNRDADSSGQSIQTDRRRQQKKGTMGLPNASLRKLATLGGSLKFSSRNCGNEEDEMTRRMRELDQENEELRRFVEKSELEIRRHLLKHRYVNITLELEQQEYHDNSDEKTVVSTATTVRMGSPGTHGGRGKSRGLSAVNEAAAAAAAPTCWRDRVRRLLYVTAPPPPSLRAKGEAHHRFLGGGGGGGGGEKRAKLSLRSLIQSKKTKVKATTIKKQSPIPGTMTPSIVTSNAVALLDEATDRPLPFSYCSRYNNIATNPQIESLPLQRFRERSPDSLTVMGSSCSDSDASSFRAEI